jgi:hypothetical protein
MEHTAKIKPIINFVRGSAVNVMNLLHDSFMELFRGCEEGAFAPFLLSFLLGLVGGLVAIVIVLLYHCKDNK